MSETSQVESLVMYDKEKELLTQIAYCAEGMFDCEINNNLGDAKDWKRQLKTATDRYFDYLFASKGGQQLQEENKRSERVRRLIRAAMESGEECPD